MSEHTGRFLMVRHGRTTANAAGILMGRTDAPLLPDSLAHAAELGRTLALTSSTVLYSSDQPRALRTAHLIGHPSALQPIPDPRLRERHFGTYTLDAFTDLAHDPAWPAIDTRYDSRPHHGETLREVEQRIFTRLLQLHRAHSPDITLVVIGHSTCWRLVQAALCRRRHDPFDEPIPPPLTVLPHARAALAGLHDYL
ncbi:histidine phosphatase family protein [Amycolatopsis magusensis]|uniref:histidine phosphatase family protein n=1 Tax=Amycolatopsis magusensis TaxID=882444 RepID=UPI00379509F0